MNSKQKRTLLGTAIIIVASLIIWIAYGCHIFTKTQVLIEKKDDLFPDMVQKEWVNEFIWGLDLTIILSVIALLCGSLLFYLFKNKKRPNELS